MQSRLPDAGEVAEAAEAAERGGEVAEAAAAAEGNVTRQAEGLG